MQKTSDKFLHGKCQVFALILHAELGLPVVDFFYGTCTAKNFCHSAVEIRPGIYLDVRGRRTIKQMNNYWTADMPQLKLRVRRVGVRSLQKRKLEWAARKDFFGDVADAYKIYARHHRRRYTSKRSRRYS